MRRVPHPFAYCAKGWDTNIYQSQTLSSRPKRSGVEGPRLSAYRRTRSPAIYDVAIRLKNLNTLTLAALALLAATGCKPPLPPSKPLSELTSQEQRGHQVFAARCAGCHYANNENPLHGPGLQGLYKKKYLPSGAAANDDRIASVIERGRNMMPAFGNTMDDEQLTSLMAYLHTL
jgi:mono/diheme cytochrome c family protein